MRCIKGTEYVGFIGEMGNTYEILVVETDGWGNRLKSEGSVKTDRVKNSGAV